LTEVIAQLAGSDAILVVRSIGAPPPRDQSERDGYGIVGMRERAAAVGGEFAAGPTADGWRVTCRVPEAAP
jgi:signal transduction histidine kinase